MQHHQWCNKIEWATDIIILPPNLNWERGAEHRHRIFHVIVNTRRVDKSNLIQKKIEEPTKYYINKAEAQVQNLRKRPPLLLWIHAKAATVAPPRWADPETRWSPWNNTKLLLVYQIHIYVKWSHNTLGCNWCTTNNVQREPTNTQLNKNIQYWTEPKYHTCNDLKISWPTIKIPCPNIRTKTKQFSFISRRFFLCKDVILTLPLI